MVYLALPIHFNYFKDFVLLENRHLICYTIFASCIPNKDSYTYIMKQLGTEATSTPGKIERQKRTTSNEQTNKNRAFIDRGWKESPMSFD